MPADSTPIIATCITSSANGIPYEWNNPAGGQFSVPGNWSPSGPPGSNDAAFFNRATTAPIVFDVSASSRLLVVSTSQVFELNDKIYDVVDMYVANAPGEHATLTLSSTHPSGGLVHGIDPAGYCVIGEEAGAIGTISVRSGGLLSLEGPLTVANYGRGTLNVQGGRVTAKATVLGRAPGGDGTINIVGASSTMLISPGGNLIAGYDGTGTINLADGGRLHTEPITQLGFNLGSFGTANVSGAGTQWSSNSPIWVGASGTGTLNIFAGGQVETAGLAIAQWYLGRGTVLVEGPGSRLTVAGGALGVGENGAGVLTIADGGTVELSDGGHVVVGGSSTGAGQMVITGTGSTIANLRDIWVGQHGCGMLTVQNGAGITSDHITVGAEIGSMGTALVAGTGSQLTALHSMRIGASGHGTMTIAGGGQVEATNHIIVLLLVATRAASANCASRAVVPA